MLEDLLSKIGFSEREARVYLELLKIGTQPVSVIAKRVSLNRSTSYGILRSLQTRGVVGCFKKSSVSYFTACDPNCLVAYIDGKCRTFEYYRTQFLNLIPELRNGSLLGGVDDPFVSSFDGVDGVANLINLVFSDSSPVSCFISPKSWLSCNVYELCLSQMLLFNTSCSLRMLFSRSAVNFNFCEDDFFGFDYRFDDVALFTQDIYIFETGVAIVNLDPHQMYAILIKSVPLAKMQQAIFDRLFSNANDEKG
jgi:hypothetical protein